MGRMKLDEHLPPSAMSTDAQDFLLSRTTPLARSDTPDPYPLPPERRIIGAPEDVAKHRRLEDVARGVLQKHGYEYTPENVRALRDDLADMYANSSDYWANANERANARADYALQGKDQNEIAKRWAESRLLLPPGQRAIEQGTGRDLRLLEGLLGSRPPEVVQENYEREKTSVMAPSRTAVTDDSGIFTVMNDPETMTGDVMSAMNYGADALRLYFGGETDGISDALTQAEGLQNYRRNYRPGTATPTPLDNNATVPKSTMARRRMLQQAAYDSAKAFSDASSPSGKERWQRFLGSSYPKSGPMSYVMPVVESASDLALEMMGDPTVLVGMPGHGRHLLKGLIGESMSEVPVGLAFQAMEAPQDMKTPEQLEKAQFNRRQWFGLQDGAGDVHNRRIRPNGRSG